MDVLSKSLALPTFLIQATWQVKLCVSASQAQMLQSRQGTRLVKGEERQAVVA